MMSLLLLCTSIFQKTVLNVDTIASCGVVVSISDLRFSCRCHLWYLYLRFLLI